MATDIHSKAICFYSYIHNYLNTLQGPSVPYTMQTEKKVQVYISNSLEKRQNPFG